MKSNNKLFSEARNMIEELIDRIEYLEKEIEDTNLVNHDLESKIEETNEIIKRLYAENPIFAENKS